MRTRGYNQTHPRHAIVTDDPTSLLDFRRPDVDLWLWRRRPAPIVLSSAERLSREPISLDVTLAADDAREALAAALPTAGVGPRDVHLWAHELAGLVALLELLGHRRVRVRLQGAGRVQPAPMFHVDGISLRLLCTYRGPGTEWLPEHAVNRLELGRQRSHALANARIARNPHSVHRIAEGWVAVLRGTGSARSRRSGLVHRSPHSATASRLLLRIDPIDG